MIETTIDKIFSFKTLENGWCHGEGLAIDDENIERAIRFESQAYLFGFKETDAFPGLNGEVTIALYFQSHYLEFTFEADSQVTFVHEKNEDTLTYNENLTFETALQTLKSLRKLLWPSSESSMKDFMTHGETDTKATHLKKPEMAAYRLLTKNVYSNPVSVSAHTSENITLKYTVNPQYTGSSTLPNFRKVA